MKNNKEHQPYNHCLFNVENACDISISDLLNRDEIIINMIYEGKAVSEISEYLEENYSSRELAFCLSSIRTKIIEDDIIKKSSTNFSEN